MSCFKRYLSLNNMTEIDEALAIRSSWHLHQSCHAWPHSRSSWVLNKTTVTQSLNGSHHICVIFVSLTIPPTLLTPHVNSNGKGTKEIRIIPHSRMGKIYGFYGTVLDRLELTMFSNDSGSVTFGTRDGEWIKDITGEYPYQNIYGHFVHDIIT